MNEHFRFGKKEVKAVLWDAREASRTEKVA